MKLQWFPVLALYLVNIASFLLFLKGFFPSKKLIPGFNDEIIIGNKNPAFDKVVLMVVDALRSDFLFGESASKFTFVHELINRNQGIPFTAFSNPPTVTLPRLKGITLGTTPNFLDAILNIADDNDKSQGLLNQDNWLYQFKNQSPIPKKINFFGDDTWLKLFPDFFDSHDGTNSFFVSDFYEVDNNVTRHLDEQLSNEADWDGLVLHYLGLDHIGHKTGPASKFMKLKHAEMDGVIERIFKFISKSSKHKNTLLVVMGDHGMNEIGNHGGSSPGETNAALLFASPKFEQLKLNLKAPLKADKTYSYYKKINQIDLIPTISLLLDIPIPKNNLGIIIKEFLPLFPKKLHHDILLKNCKQLFQLFAANNKNTEFSTEYDKLQTLEDDYSFLFKLQSSLIEKASNYNISELHYAILGTFVCLTIVLYFFNSTFISKASLYSQVAIAIFSLHYHGSSLIEEEHHLWWLLNVIYWIALFVYYKFKLPFLFFILLSGTRLIRAWSNTGQKYNDIYVFSSFLLENPSLLWILIGFTYAVCGFYVYFQGSLRHCFNFLISAKGYDLSYLNNDINNGVTFISLSILVGMCFTFKLLQGYLDGYQIPGWLNTFIQWNLLSFDISEFDKGEISQLLISLSNSCSIIISVFIGFRILFRFLRGFQIATLTDIINLFTLFLLNVTRIELIPMFLVFFIIRGTMGKLILKKKDHYKHLDTLVILISLFNLLISNLSFFSMGGTNLLATVDLSNAYNGVKSYEIVKVSLLTFVSNFSGPIYWSLSSLQLVLETNIAVFKIGNFGEDLITIKNLKFKVLNLKLLVNLVFYSICCLSLIASCYNLRYHLFIWTVFLPKLLYFGVWFVLINILIELGLSSIVLALS